MGNGWGEFISVLLVLCGLAATLGLVGLLLLHRSLRRLDVPQGADFFTTLRIVPLSLVVTLDLLDLGLDVFATPIVWLVLSRYRLHALRNVSTVEALIPFTQAIPTLTVAWILVRAFGLGSRSQSRSVIEADQEAPGYYVPRGGKR
jgi:hypothetical protein